MMWLHNAACEAFGNALQTGGLRRMSEMSLGGTSAKQYR